MAKQEYVGLVEHMCSFSCVYAANKHVVYYLKCVVSGLCINVPLLFCRQAV
jgi:hypothetical protein